MFAITVIAFSAVGCTEKHVSIDPPVIEPTAAIPPVTLDTHKNFNPRKTVEVYIDYSGAKCSKVLFEVYAENPYEVVNGQIAFRSDLIALASAFTDEKGKYSGTAELPLNVDEVYIYSPDFGAPTLYKTNLVGNVINAQIDYNNEILITDMLEEVETKAIETKGKNDYPWKNELGEWDKKGKPKYLDGAHQIVIDETMTNTIKNVLPEGKIASPKLISNDVDITLYETASSV